VDAASQNLGPCEERIRNNFAENKEASIKMVGESFGNLQYEEQLVEAKHRDRSGDTGGCIEDHLTKTLMQERLDRLPSIHTIELQERIIWNIFGPW
jgi:hypothetical protein